MSPIGTSGTLLRFTIRQVPTSFSCLSSLHRSSHHLYGYSLVSNPYPLPLSVAYFECYWGFYIIRTSAPNHWTLRGYFCSDHRQTSPVMSRIVMNQKSCYEKNYFLWFNDPMYCIEGKGGWINSVTSSLLQV